MRCEHEGGCACMCVCTGACTFSIPLVLWFQAPSSCFAFCCIARDSMLITQNDGESLDPASHEEPVRRRQLHTGVHPPSYAPDLVASPGSTGTSSSLPWARLLDRLKDPPQRGLHPDRCKARVARDGGGVRRRGLWRVVGPAGFGLSAAWDEVGMHRYDFLGDWGGDRFDTSGRC